MLKTFDKLSEEAKSNALKEFVRFAEVMGHDASHSTDEFVETSNANGWLYDNDGKFIK